MALLQWSFRKILLNLCFSVAPDKEQAVDNFNFRTEDLSTDVFADIEDFERGITIVTDEEIQANTVQFNFSNCSFVFNISK